MIFDTPQYNFKEAKILGSADKATILTFIRWSIASKQGDHCAERYKTYYFFDGVWWMQDGFAAWQARFPWLSLRTIKTYFNDLCQAGAILKKAVGSRNNGREPNFYRINPEWDEALAKVGHEDIDALKAKIALGGLSAEIALVECRNCTTPSAEIALISTSNDHTQKSSQLSPDTDPSGLPSADAPGGSLPSVTCPIEIKINELATQWLYWCKSVMPSQAKNRYWTPEAYAKQFKLIMSETGLNPSGLEALMGMIPKHRFWATKAISPFGWLNKSKDDETMRKIDHMLADLRNSKEYREQRAMAEAIAKMDDPNYKPLF